MKSDMQMKEITQWLLALSLPFFLCLVFLGRGTILLPLGGLFGAFVGLAAAEPYFTAGFKTVLATALFTCVSVFVLGLWYSARFSGKLLVFIAVYAWCFVGLAGFGPQ